MYIEDDNVVYLCTVRLDGNYDNTISFDNKQQRESYFKNKAKHTIVGVTFVREPRDGEPLNYFDVELPISDVSSVNYIMYKNSNESDYKFAFVNNMRYYNEEMVRLYLEDDVLQNNLFKLKFGDCYIERETQPHSNLNTLADSVAHGALKAVKTDIVNMTGAYFVFCSSPPIADKVDDLRPFALKIGRYSTPCFVMYWNRNEGEEMAKIMQGIANKGWSDRILSAVYIPLVAGDSVRTTRAEIKGVGYINIVEEIDERDMKETFTFTYPVDPYVKSLTYPYSKIVLRDQPTGQTVELAPELFATLGVAEFEVRGSIGESPIYKIIPKNYAGQPLAFNQALVVKAGTGLQVANNLYSKYLMQNSEMNQFSKTSTALNAGASLAGSAVSGDAAGAVTGLVSAYQDIKKVAIVENQAAMLGNSVTAYNDDAIFRLNFPNSWDIALFSMDSNHKDMATSFWNRFGYPINRVYKPDIFGFTGRKFIRILEPVIYGDIETAHKERLVNIFKNGIAFWKNEID